MTGATISRLPVLAVSFILAVSLFLFVQIENPNEKGPATLAVPLRVVGLAGRQVTITTIPESVDVRVEGPQEEIDRLRSRPILIDASVDLSKCESEKACHPNVVLVRPAGMDDLIMHLQRRTVYAELEAIKSKSLKVEVLPQGHLAEENLTYDGAKVDPGSVVVSGGQTLLQGVRAVVKLDLNEVMPNRVIQMPVELVDEHGDPVDGVTISGRNAAVISPFIHPRPAEKPVLVNVNFAGHVAEGYEVLSYSVMPSQAIRVTGQGPAFNTITVTSVTVNLDGLTAPKKFLVKPNLPAGVRMVGGTMVQVMVSVQRILKP